MNTPLMLRGFRLTLGVSLVLFSKPSALAQWTSNTALNTPVGVSSNNKENVATVSDGAGGAIVVWEENVGGATSIDIIAQRIDALGNMRWSATGVAVSAAAGDQRLPMVAADGLGGAIVTWYDTRGMDTNIYAQRVDSAGAVLWAADGVPICVGPGNHWDPVITGDGLGGGIIAWYEERYDTTADIYAQHISGDGVVQWTTDGVPVCTAPNGQVTPVITTDGVGGAIVAWLDFRDGVVELFSQRVSQSGLMLWQTDGVRLCDASDFQYAPAITADGSGGAIITWNDFMSGMISDIYAQRISNAGLLQWSASGTGVCTAPNYQYRPQIVSDGSLGAILCWYDYRNGVSSDIYAQRLSPLGAPLWAQDGVQLCGAPNDQQFPSIIKDGRGGAFVGWQDNRNGPNADIFAQHVTSVGVIGFQTDGVVVSTAVNGKRFPKLINNLSGGAILAWEDGRSGTKQDVFAQRIVLENPDAAFGYWMGGVSATIEAAPAYTGLHPNALDGTDSRDISEPSTLPLNFLSLTSISLLPADRLVQDIRQETPRLSYAAKRYSLQSRTSTTGSAVNLVFTEDRLPYQFTPVLYDVGAGSYRDLRSMPVYSYTSPSTPGEPKDFLLLLGDSTKPSISIISPNGGEVLVVGIPSMIRWNSSDSSGLLRHYIYYTLTGAPPFTLLDSTSGQSASYPWTPVDASINAFIRIVAVDSVLNMSADTSDAPFTIVAGDSVAYTTHAGWNMIGVPVLQTDMSPQGVFADDLGGASFSTFGFDPISGYTIPDTLRLGEGYWLRTQSDQVIDAVGVTQAVVTLPLPLGWSIIGNPFPAPFQKSSLRFTDGVTTKTINEAQVAGWLVNRLYGFDGNGYVEENQSLSVWNGYWLRTLVANLEIVYDFNAARAIHPWSGPIRVNGSRPNERLRRVN